LIQIDAIFIGKWVEDIHMFNSILTSLFVAVDEVYPVIDVLRDVSFLELFSNLCYEIVRISSGPTRQGCIVHLFFILGYSIVVIVFVDEHLRQSVNLRDEFSNISGAGRGILPGSTITVKDTVCAVEFATLHGQSTNTIRSDSDEEIEDDG
jgi:hypothetical protein